jgi:hypothetical protein
MFLPPDPLEIHRTGFIRRRCRNPRCGSQLKCETDRPRDAFCCRACFEQHYRTVCLVCDRPMRQKGGRRRQFCCKRCQSEFHRLPERFSTRWRGAATPLPDAGRNALTSAHSTGLKSRTKSDRAWRITAGPAAGLDPVNLAIPLDPETAARNRRANAHHWVEATLIGPRDWPIDWVGGGDLARELDGRGSSTSETHHQKREQS